MVNNTIAISVKEFECLHICFSGLRLKLTDITSFNSASDALAMIVMRRLNVEAILIFWILRLRD